MAEEKKNVSIDPKDVDRAKAMAELFEKIEETVDRTRGVTKQKQELAEQETRSTEEILDLTKKIETRKQKILQLEGSLAKELGVYQKIQKNIAENESKLANSEYKSDIIKDQIKQQNIMLAQKQAQFQQEIASGKITERTAAARRREIGSIKDIIKAKEREGKQEEYIQSILNKKIAGGLIAAGQQKILVDQIEHKLNLEKTGLYNDEKALALLKKQQEERTKTKDLNERIAQIGKFIESNLLSESVGYGKIKGLVTDIAKGGLTAWLALIKASLDRWKELDKAALNFRQNTGFLVSQTKELDKAVREVNVQMANLGVTIGDAYAAASALTNEFQVIGLVTKEAIANTAMMAANLGLNVQDAAKFKGLFESISQEAGSSGDSMIKSAAALAEMGGVAPRAVLNDMANASEETLAFLAKSPMALMRATVEARRLGTTVNSLSKSARGFLNYQDSITSELEASALIGKSLNFQEARAAAYAGDVVKSRELALKQIEKAGDFTELNVYQQEALAKAAGMTTGEIIKQQNQQKLLAKLEQTKPELYKKYMEMQEKIKENEKAAAEDLEKQAEEMAKRQLMQSEMNKLTSAFDAIWTDISDSLLAIANNIMPPIIIAARLLGGIFKIIGAVIRGFLTPFDRIGSSLRSGTDGGLMLEKVMTAILGGVQSIVPYVEKLAEVAGYAVNAFAFLAVMIGKGAAGAKPFVAIAEFFEKIAERVRTFSNGLSGIGKAFKPILQGVAGFVKFLGTFARFLGPIGLIISAIQLVVSLWKRFSNLFASDEFVNARWYERIWLGIKAIGGALYDTLIQPFVDVYDWIKEKLMGSSPSEIGLGIVDGIKSIGGMLLSALTWPFRTVVNFVSGIFGLGGTLGTMIVDSVKNIAGTVFDFLTWPHRKLWDFVSELFSGGGSGILGTILGGIKSTAATVYDFLAWPFRRMWDFVFDLFSGGDSGILGSILDGLKSVGSSIVDILISPFKTVINFISGIFGGDGSIGETIINGIKSVMGGVFDLLVSPFKNAFEVIKKLPFVGKLFGGGDATATLSAEAKADVEKQVAMAVEVKNINELKETVDKLTEAISKLGGTAGGASPVVNVNNNQNAMIEKLDELIGLLKDGAIAVNMDGIQVSRTLAKVT
jgi:hypothetical protein